MSFLEALHDLVPVCDGAMGSMLYDRGVFVNQSFEALNLAQTDLVVDVHRAYIDAGADVIETNTFFANRVKLAGFELDDRLAEVNPCLGTVSQTSRRGVQLRSRVGRTARRKAAGRVDVHRNG